MHTQTPNRSNLGRLLYGLFACALGFALAQLPWPADRLHALEGAADGPLYGLTWEVADQTLKLEAGFGRSFLVLAQHPEAEGTLGTWLTPGDGSRKFSLCRSENITVIAGDSVARFNGDTFLPCLPDIDNCPLPPIPEPPDGPYC